MGIRMMSAWKLPASLSSPRAVASDPNPRTALMPLKAMTAVQALCSKMKSRPVKLTTHIREVALRGRGTVGVSEISFMNVVVSLTAISDAMKSAA
ncbi:MAG: hypothetical protein JWQ42_4683 [Edaphobacter sp.]|nr:hypothetical protein [Edaphobacter sp.]